jgi:hypothetical protein
MSRQLIVALSFLLGGAVTAHGAVTTSISSSAGSLYSTGSIASFEPTGEDMVGMQVKATFANGFAETRSWVAGAVGSKMGSATGTSLVNGWSLTEGPGASFAGDTYGGEWKLTVNPTNTSSSPLTELLLMGVPGKTLFDLKDPSDLTSGAGVDPNVFTPGSEKGWTFEIFNASAFPPSYNLNVHASFENAVQVGVGPVQYDLFTTLRLTMTGPTAGSGLNRGFTLVFYQDTDLAGGPVIVTPPVPEPTSLCLFAGLAIVGGWSCRRRLCSTQPAALA